MFPKTLVAYEDVAGELGYFRPEFLKSETDRKKAASCFYTCCNDRRTHHLGKQITANILLNKQEWKMGKTSENTLYWEFFSQLSQSWRL